MNNLIKITTILSGILIVITVIIINVTSMGIAIIPTIIIAYILYKGDKTNKQTLR